MSRAYNQVCHKKLTEAIENKIEVCLSSNFSYRLSIARTLLSAKDTIDPKTVYPGILISPFLFYLAMDSIISKLKVVKGITKIVA